jgi:hypothetical protein
VTFLEKKGKRESSASGRTATGGKQKKLKGRTGFALYKRKKPSKRSIQYRNHQQERDQETRDQVIFVRIRENQNAQRWLFCCLSIKMPYLQHHFAPLA